MIQGIAATILVDMLIKYGVSKITDKADAELVAKTAKDAYGVILDMNKPASENAALLRPMIVNEMETVSKLAMGKATSELDKLPDEVANSTLLASYGGFSKGARAIVWLMVFFYVAIVGGFAFEYLAVLGTLTYLEVLTFIFYCLGGLVAVAIIPVRALAYLVVSIASQAGANKAKK